eukprot:1519487-Pyramimonas_sp.AAC.1
MGRHAGTVEAALSGQVRVFGESGLDIHEVELFTEKGSALGVDLDGARLVTCLTAKRRVRLERGLLYLFQRGRASGQMVES